VVRGEQQPDIDPEAAKESPGAASELRRHQRELATMDSMAHHFLEIEDKMGLKWYGTESKTWESRCGTYRIRYGTHCHGVKVEHPFKVVHQPTQIVTPFETKLQAFVFVAEKIQDAETVQT
jgi:hypothetical protein